jgi:hypothetical protein
MARLTSNQLTELGDCFLRIAQSVGDYRIENRANLSKAENQRVKELHRELLDYSDEFYTTAARLVIDDIKRSMEKIVTITQNINRSYKKLKDFQKAIDIAAAAVKLAGSVLTKNPVTINNAINDLEEIIKKK